MLLWLACALAFGLALVHTFPGGAKMLPPLLESEDIPEPIKLIHYYCWHIVTILLFGLAASFAYAAYEPTGRILAVVATGISFMCLAWGYFLVVWKKQKHKDMPQWMLFLPQTAIGIYALI